MIIALQIIAGLALLVLGGEALVRGAVSIAKRLDIPTIVIGLTIVSFGTSAPELVVSTLAAMSGHPDIAIGNVLGSNIANILLVLGPTAIVCPILVKPDVIKRELILVLIVSALFVVFALDGSISQLEGGLFLVILCLYYFDLYRNVTRGGDAELQAEIEEEVSISLPLIKALPLTVAAGVALVFGADILVDGASELARLMGISEGVIALTVIAIGTSAPELVTSLVAAWHKHSDIAVGNVIGSNLFNILGVIGVTASIQPISVAQKFLDFDFWFMLGVAAVLVPVMRSGYKISRREGVILLLAYVAYTAYQYMGTVV